MLIKQANIKFTFSAVASIKRLAQHLSGLRSGCSLQHNFLLDRAKSDTPHDSNKNGDNTSVDDNRVNFEAFEERVGPSLDNLVVCRLFCCCFYS